MDYLWNTVETVDRSKCDGFSHFDTGHMEWLVLFLCFAFLCTVIYLKAGGGRKRIRQAFAVVMIADEVLKYIIAAVNGISALAYLPLQLCSLSIIIVILHALFAPAGWHQNIFSRYAGNFLYLIGLPAGLSALLFPAWTALPPFANLMSIHSFSVHIMLVTYVIMLLVAEEIRPEIKTIPVNICVLIAMAIGVYLFDVRFGMNYMYLVHLSPASPLAPFAALGDYRIGYAIILVALVLVMYGLPAFFRKRRSRG